MAVNSWFIRRLEILSLRDTRRASLEEDQTHLFILKHLQIAIV